MDEGLGECVDEILMDIGGDERTDYRDSASRLVGYAKFERVLFDGFRNSFRDGCSD